MRRPWITLAGFLAAAFLAASCPETVRAAKKPGAAKKAPTATAVASSVKVTAREVSFDLGGGVKLDMVKLDGGYFNMGSPLSPRETARKYKGDSEIYLDQGPVHKVKVNGFLMGKYEVTRAQFGAFVRATGYRTEAEDAGMMEGLDWRGDAWAPKDGCNWKLPGFLQSNSHPVVGVSHNDAVAFCAWLSKKTGKTFRLPTEAEWEYADRAGSATEYPWGDDVAGGEGYANLCDQTAQEEARRHGTSFSWTAPYEDGYVFTSPAGKFKPNAFGIHDMQGNVEEWCADWCEPYYYDVSPTDNPKGPEKGDTRVVRGGNWYLAPGLSRSAYRSGYPPEQVCDQVGFRVACEN